MLSKNIAVLGSTGSIGVQTLRVAKRLRLKVVALSCNSDTEKMEKQARQVMPDIVAVRDAAKYRALKSALADTNIKIIAGDDAAGELADYIKADTVVNAIVGIAGLKPTLTALRRGVRLALANKESLVAAGTLVMEAQKAYGSELLPVDSEHSAIFQCLNGEKKNPIKKILLTASGGPFFGKTRADLESVTIQQALAHPKWKMGKKITVDSATLMNKGLELIEAMHLFHVKADQIEILIHRQSIVHSAVEFMDGAVMAQMGNPDMGIPIQYSLTYPKRKKTGCSSLSLCGVGELSFEKPNIEVFACLGAAIKASKIGGLAPCAVNGANEAAVGNFLMGKIPFLKIGELVAGVLEEKSIYEGNISVEAVFETDRRAREYIDSKIR